MERLVVKVALQGIAGSGDKLYSFYVSPELRERVAIGSRVIVPFGRSNKKYRAVVFEMGRDCDIENIKPILSVAKESRLLDEDSIRLAVFMKKRYFCSYYDGVKALLPTATSLVMNESFSISAPLYEGATASVEEIYQFISSAETVSAEKLYSLFPGCENTVKALEKKGCLVSHSAVSQKLSDKTVSMVRLSKSLEDSLKSGETAKYRSPKWYDCIILLKENGPLSDKEIMYMTGVKKSTLVSMKNKGLVEFYREETLRRPKLPNINVENVASLSPSQKDAYEKITDSKKAVCLLYGVTGSGKTHIFLKLASDCLGRGQGVIVLVPEISLTAQMTARFCRQFGNDLAIIHSGLSAGERYDEWKRIKNGEAKIVVGTRSAVFSPVHNLGLIIIDEEQEHTYKSEMSPRYSAKEIARFRCAKALKKGVKCRLVLSSATPSVESFHLACEGKYELVELPTRFNKSPLPDCTVVDMRQELRGGNTGVLSDKLKEELGRNLAAGEQSILFINRRGYNSFVSCRSCGYVAKCPQCDISLTYHASNNRLMCHYCGYSTENFTSCPSCGQQHIRYFGSGTQKVEDELRILFPDSRVCRMDADTTLRKSSHEKIIEDFAAGKYDILVGTQMITKGLDFENVTLAAVVAADIGLYSGEFRASERTFSLLTQLTGRAGRGGKSGRAIIQTYTPDNPVLGLAITQDYKRFFQSEIIYRRSLLYPPFCDICQLLFEGANESEVKECAEGFAALMKKRVEATDDLPVKGYGPLPASIPKINNTYRYKLLLKCRSGSAFSRFLNDLTEEYEQEKKYRHVRLRIDLNPEIIS